MIFETVAPKKAPMRSDGLEDHDVLAHHHAFAEPLLAELFDEAHDLGVGFRPGNHFQQVQVAGRIEEVRAQEIAAELLGKAFGDMGQRNAAGAGGENGARPGHRFHAAEQVALNGQVFGHGFNHPVATGDLPQVVVVVAGFDQPRQLVGEKRRRLLLDQRLDRFGGGGAAVGFVRTGAAQQ